MNFLKIFFVLLFTFEAFAINKEWWKHASIYQIYLRSFQDSNGDGIGDIKGLISRLDYLVDIGVDTIYLMPFYPSSWIDGGYDIVDYKGIDPVYGTMEDFELLMKEAKSRGLYCLTDMVINHSSDEHEWFQKSINKTAPYTDYYVWADPKGYDPDGKPIRPNNWFSVFSLNEDGTAWTWNEERKQFYLHQMNIKQPDLNLRNEAVKAEIKDMMKFWLEKGVSGFRVDAPMFFMEDEQLRDNLPLSPEATVFTMFAECERTFNHPDTFRFINELNVFLKQYDRESGNPIQTPLIGETYGPIKNVIKYYGTKKFPVFHLPFNFLLTSLTTYFDARGLYDYLHTWLDAVPKDMPSNWALGNHDQGRVAYHLNTEYNPIMLALATILPGTCSLYYGEELSLGQNNLVREKDRYNRVFHRTPMQWDDTRNAGFSTADRPWLPVHPNYWKVNVRNQKSQENSSLNFFKDLMTLRKTDTVKYGDLKFHPKSEWVLVFSRTYRKTSYIVIMNLGTDTQPLDWPADSRTFPTVFTVVASSPNAGYRKGFMMEADQYYPVIPVLRPHSVIILKHDSLLP